MANELPPTINVNITDEELRHRLINDHQIQCGPVTAQTRRILLKKLIKLENEKLSNINNNDNLNNSNNESNGGNSFDNNSYSNNSSINDDNNDQQHQNMKILNGNDHNYNYRSEDIHRSSSSTSSIPPRAQSSPLPAYATPRQQQQTTVTTTPSVEEIEAIKTFKEIEKSFKQPATPNRRSTSIVHNQSLNEFSSESSDDDPTNDDEVLQTTAPTISANISSKISGITMPRVSNEYQSYRPSYSSLSRAPIRHSTATISNSNTSFTSSIFDTNKNQSLLNYSDSESDNEQPAFKKDRIRQVLLDHRPGLARSRYLIRNNYNNNNNKRSFKNVLASLYQNSICKLWPSSGTSINDKSSLNQSIIKRKSDRNFNQFSTLSSSSSTNFISLALLMFVIIFFIVIFSIYFYSKLTHQSRYTLDLNDYTFIEDKNKLLAPICNQINDDNDIDCLPFESDKKPALNVIKEIKSLIDKHIYETYCGGSTLSSSSKQHLPDITSFKFKRLDFEREIRQKIAITSTLNARDESVAQLSRNQLFDRDLLNAMKLIKLNKQWNINVDPFLSELSLTPDYNVNLSLQCSLIYFWRTNFTIIISTIAIGFLSVISLLYYRYSKNKELQEQELVYDLIEKSVELLQSPDEPQSMPVLHIRDTLLSPAEKKSSKYKRIWDNVVKHIEHSESRVKVELKEIDGEEFKAWKWIASTSNSPYATDNENDQDSFVANSSQTQKIGGVEWQGQAFAFATASSPNKTNQSSPSSSSAAATTNNDNNNLDNKLGPTSSYSTMNEMMNNRNKNFHALTRFLKIRNIFEKEAQYVDPDWSKKIKNTILEKTAKTSANNEHDIVHIEIDDSTNEGLVFLKCKTMAGATNAFHALHGWWCEKKLVSVKFLKEDRYYQRFPHARFMDEPLQMTIID